MQDDRLLPDMRALGHPHLLEHANKWEQHGIRTYSQLLTLLRDESENEKLRAEACWDLGSLRKQVDGRRVIPILLKLFHSESWDLRRSAIHTLGWFHSMRALELFLQLLADPQSSIYDRMDAIHALNSYEDKRVATLYGSIMFDVGNDVRLRALAMEWTPLHEGMIDTWLAFLSDPLPDIRFWAAYRLTQTWDDIPTIAITVVDHVAAFDHTLPKTWGWHVDRELLPVLERLHTRPYRLEDAGDRDEDGLPNYSFHLVSAAPEYEDFVKQYRSYQQDWFYEARPEPAIDLRIDPDWLREQITMAWEGVTFNVRQPKPQTYMLDWHIVINGHNLLGGLHRDGYAIVLSGRDDAAYAFAAWLRRVIAPEHRLYIYEWADVGIELTPGMTATQIDQAYYALDEAHRAPLTYSATTNASHE